MIEIEDQEAILTQFRLGIMSNFSGTKAKWGTRFRSEAVFSLDHKAIDVRIVHNPAIVVPDEEHGWFGKVNRETITAPTKLGVLQATFIRAKEVLAEIEALAAGGQTLLDDEG